MTPQVTVALILLLVGVAIKVTAAILKLPEIGLIGEMTNFGFLLLGKELMPASAAAQAKRASIAPKVGIVLAMLLLVSCVSAPTPADIRDTTRSVCAAGKAAETIAEVAHERAAREDAGAADPALGGLDAGAQDAAPVSP